MRHETFSAAGYGRSPQIRADLPEGADAPHPRMLEMADRLRDLAALGTGVGFKDLIGAGFTAAEITEHYAEAERRAVEASTRQVGETPDLVSELVRKAIDALPDRRPWPKGTKDSQATFVGLANYCKARAALVLDPWDGQRERCMSQLASYLRQTSAGPNLITHVVARVSEALYAGTKAGKAGAAVQ